MGDDSLPPLSEAQQEIMELIWERGELSAFEVRQILGTQREVARETVRTLLARMEEKGWLQHRTVGRTYFYSAVIPRDTSLGQQVAELVDNLCGGSPKRLMTLLMDHRGLSDEELRQIQQMLAEAEKQERRQR